jgi:hypothetical protein
MERDALKTLDQMVAEASAAGLGESEWLRCRFVEFQRCGLLGGPERKEPRRGGAGLWHPVQGALWLVYLQHRREGFSLPTLTNIPIGVWMLGIEGVRAEQAQRALCFGAQKWLPPDWQRRMPPSTAARRLGRGERRAADRSLAARNTRRAVERLADQDTRPAAKRRLFKALRQVLDGIPDPDLMVGKPTFTQAVSRVRPRTPADDSHRIGAAIYQMLSDRFLALAYLDILCSTLPQVVGFWEWARGFWQYTFARYHKALPALQARSGLGDLFETPTLNQVANEAGSWLLGILGAGIRALHGDVEPAIRRYGLPEAAWAKLFPRGR